MLSKLLFIKILLMVRALVVLSKAILTYLRQAPRMLLSPLLELWVVHVMPNLRTIMLALVTV